MTIKKEEKECASEGEGGKEKGVFFLSREGIKEGCWENEPILCKF